MAVGDDAVAAGYPLVPASGTTDPAKVRNGYTEINRTRDFIAQIKLNFMSFLTTVPVNKGGTGSTQKAPARANLGIRSGTANPSGGEEGDIYFKIVG